MRSRFVATYFREWWIGRGKSSDDSTGGARQTLYGCLRASYHSFEQRSAFASATRKTAGKSVQFWSRIRSSGYGRDRGSIAQNPAPVDTGSLPSRDEARRQLARILESANFSATDRLRAFLAYVVKESLAGRADRIKGYTIATDVFGRNPSFDAHSDPIVRVQAGHLRRALELYYLTTGKQDPVVISIPRGAYAPLFERSGATPESPAPPFAISRVALGTSFATALLLALGGVLWLAAPSGSRSNPSAPDLPRLIVKPFTSLASDDSMKGVAEGLSQEITAQVAKFKDIVIVNAAAIGPDGERERYELVGTVSVADDRMRVQAQLHDVANGAVLWADSYNANFSKAKVFGVEYEIASRVATALAQPYGVVFAADAAHAVQKAPDDWTAYACTLSYYTYRANLDGRIHPSVRACLEQAVGRFPTYATAWALLSQTYVDELRFGYAIDPTSSPASVERALSAARMAVALDPGNVRALQAEMLALYINGDRQEALDVGRRALTLNSNDMELMGEYGFRLALAGDWQRGCELLEQAHIRNPTPYDYLESALAICAYFLNDQALAIRRIRRAQAPENAWHHIGAAAILAEGGLAAEAARERDWLLANAPAMLRTLRHQVETRFARPQDRERLLESLEKAGVTSPD
jgi:TolB-like protein